MADKNYSDFASGTPTSSDIILFANPATGLLKKCTLATLLGGDEFIAVNTQAGTAAPTMTILRNTRNLAPVWSRTGAGNYNLTQVGAFGDANILIVPYAAGGGVTEMGLGYSVPNDWGMAFFVDNADVIKWHVYDPTYTNDDWSVVNPGNNALLWIKWPV